MVEIKKKIKGQSPSLRKDSKVKDLEEKLKRSLADYQNLEKRFHKERESLTRWANAILVEKLLGALDDLERAEEHFKDPGLKMALNKLRQVLHSEGLEKIEVAGKKFDPAQMDCVGLVAGPKDMVCKVVCKGYKLGDIVLRAARVEVGKGEGEK